jgi:hypothetical protein
MAEKEIAQLLKEKEIIQLWKEKGVANIDYEFDCGGDDMGDTTLNILDKKGELIECEKIEDYFENKIYDVVDFYVNSDGHYMGERGSVYITLEEDEEEPYFSYSKTSMEEYNEHEQFDEMIELSDEEIEYISSYVNNINIGWGGDINFNYVTDFIQTDRHEELEKSIDEKLTKFYNDYEPELLGEDSETDMSFNTNEDENVITIEGNKLKVTLYYDSYVYKEGIE